MMRRRRARGRRSARPRDRQLAAALVSLAEAMIDRYDGGAIIQAAIEGNALLGKGDVDGLMAWLKVIVAINRLQATKPAEGERVQ